jgi:transposase
MKQKERLWELYRKEKDGKVRERILMVIWSMERCSSYEIGERLNCPHSKVLYWIKRFEREGYEGLETKGRSGKPSSLTDQEKKRIRERLESKNFWKTKWVTELIQEESGVTYTQRHVVRLLQSWGFRKIIPWKEHEYQAGKEEREKLKKGDKSSGVSARRLECSNRGRVHFCL